MQKKCGNHGFFEVAIFDIKDYQTYMLLKSGIIAIQRLKYGSLRERYFAFKRSQLSKTAKIRAVTPSS